jgi:hypothetical protein
MCQRPCQARRADRAACAHSLGAPGLIERSAVSADGEEQLGIGAAACRTVAPVRLPRRRRVMRTGASHGHGLSSLPGASAPRRLSGAAISWSSAIVGLVKLANGSPGLSKAGRAVRPSTDDRVEGHVAAQQAHGGIYARPLQRGRCGQQGRTPRAASAPPWAASGLRVAPAARSRSRVRSVGSASPARGQNPSRGTRRRRRTRRQGDAGRRGDSAPAARGHSGACPGGKPSRRWQPEAFRWCGGRWSMSWSLVSPLPSQCLWVCNQSQSPAVSLARDSRPS